MQIEHWNVRGLQDHKKRKKVFDRILSSKTSLDICALTETHANHQLATSYSLQLWPYKNVWTAHSSSSAGVALIILNQNITAELIANCPNGTYLVIKLSNPKWPNPITLVILYVPSKSKLRLWHHSLVDQVSGLDLNAMGSNPAGNLSTPQVKNLFTEKTFKTIQSDLYFLS